MWSDLLKFPENAVLMVYGILSGPDHKGENRLGTGTETESGTGSIDGKAPLHADCAFINNHHLEMAGSCFA